MKFITNIINILEPGGKLLFTVWALEQTIKPKWIYKGNNDDYLIPWLDKYTKQTFHRFYHLFSFDEINKCSLRECFNYIDILIDGKFEEDFKITNGLRGSSNQNVISFSNKIFEEEISIDHEIEIGMLEEQIFLTGFPKLDKKYLKQLGVIV